MTTDKPEVTAYGTFRVYFTQEAAAPLMWGVMPSPDTPSGAWPRWEMAVRAVTITVPVRAVFQPKDTPSSEDGLPSAWMEATGRLTVFSDGFAFIEGDDRSTP